MISVGDAVLSALNGYKQDAMSRAEAILLITESLRQRCESCQSTANDPEKSQELEVGDTAWEG
ncbi:MAG: hypothetical protein QMC95_06440 [Desulfitobacteriaceae bacterium]|nr:hypothetical protein [Desulfitobacteriaceae bacterium]